MRAASQFMGRRRISDLALDRYRETSVPVRLGAQLDSSPGWNTYWLQEFNQSAGDVASDYSGWCKWLTDAFSPSNPGGRVYLNDTPTSGGSAHMEISGLSRPVRQPLQKEAWVPGLV